MAIACASFSATYSAEAGDAARASRRRRAPRRVASSPVAALSSGGPGEEGLASARAPSPRSRPARHVGAARGRRAVHDRDHRQPGGREAREIGEQLAAARRISTRSEQVGAGRSRPGARRAACSRARSPARAGTCRCPSAASRRPRCPRRRRRACTRVPRDRADAGDEAAAGDAARGVGRVLQPAGEGAKLEEGQARVEQPRDALARQQLAALLEQRARLGAGVARALLERAPSRRSARACARGSRRRPPRGVDARGEGWASGVFGIAQHASAWRPDETRRTPASCRRARPPARRAWRSAPRRRCAGRRRW